MYIYSEAFGLVVYIPTANEDDRAERVAIWLIPGIEPAEEV